jgi:phosphoadenosine phosphosulfate reductase
MVVIDLLARAGRLVPAFYLDTDLLFPETHELIARVRERYGIEPLAVKPALSLAEQAADYGDALWTRDPDRCCALRKVAPQRAFLASYAAWITGLRRDQSPGRAGLESVEWDQRSGGLAKINPLADWTERDVWAYVAANDVPYNVLNDRGFPSAGCVPCTRRVGPGEDARAGRWPGFEKTECGLHDPSAAVPLDPLERSL